MKGVVVFPANSRQYPFWLPISSGEVNLEDLKAPHEDLVYDCLGRFEMHFTDSKEYVAKNWPAHQFLVALQLQPPPDAPPIGCDVVITGPKGGLLSVYLGEWILLRRYQLNKI